MILLPCARNSKRLSAFLLLTCASSICRVVSGFTVSSSSSSPPPIPRGGVPAFGVVPSQQSIHRHSHRTRSSAVSFTEWRRQSPPSTTITTDLSMVRRGGRPRGPVRTFEVKPPMNDEIEYDRLRVVATNPSGKDEALGIMSKADALARASELGDLDLILINTNSDPPVCKIVDYSKYRYMKEKKAKETKKKSKASEVKEVKMSYKIDTHDYEVRKKSAAKFLQQGNRVKCTVMFKGREVTHEKLGVDLIQRLADDLNDICLMEGKPQREGRSLSCIVSPRQEILKSINEKKRAEEKAAKKKKAERRAAMEEKAVAAAAAAAATGEKVDLDEDDVNGFGFDEDDDDDDDERFDLDSILSETEDEDDEDDDDDEALDALLGSDDAKDDLFN